MIRKTFLLLAASLVLGACGDLEADLGAAKQEAASLGREALEASASVVDTRTACLLTGQSDAFCGCIAERIGNRIEPEHIDAFRQALGATIAGEPIPASASDQNASATRQAVVACATRAAISDAATEAGN